MIGGMCVFCHMSPTNMLSMSKVVESYPPDSPNKKGHAEIIELKIINLILWIRLYRLKKANKWFKKLHALTWNIRKYVVFCY